MTISQAQCAEIGQSVPQTGDYFIEILVSLVLVLGIIFLSAWMLRRFGRFPGVAEGNLRVLGALSVGQREKILLLQVGKEQVLVGVTASRISRIHELQTPVDVPEAQNFSNERLSKFFNKRPASSPESPNKGFTQNFQEALKAQFSSKPMASQSDPSSKNIPTKNQSCDVNTETLPAGDSSDCGVHPRSEERS